MTVTDPYRFYLRVSADNHAQRDIPLYVYVDQSGRGSALFKIMDIYTGTLDAQSNLIQGLAGARIRMIKEEGTSFETNLVTDTIGEAFAQSLPVGRYNVRVSASGHNDLSDRIWIKPGVTVSKEYTLEERARDRGMERPGDHHSGPLRNRAESHLSNRRAGARRGD